MKTIEQAIIDKILYIGNEIPKSLMTDQRPKFIVLGTPQELIDETTKEDIMSSDNNETLQPTAIENRIKKLKEVTKIQCSKGNYDLNEYMRGMANGLILAEAIIENKDPQYLEKDYPEKDRFLKYP